MHEEYRGGKEWVGQNKGIELRWRAGTTDSWGGGRKGTKSSPGHTWTGQRHHPRDQHGPLLTAATKEM